MAHHSLVIPVFAAIAFAAMVLGSTVSGLSQQPPPRPYRLVIHGGAGTLPRDQMTPEREAAYRAALTDALKIGQAVLERGGSSLDAVEATIMSMEDCPLFNAGKGAVFNHDGKNELDAAIMDGATLKAGSVAALHRIRNPVVLARLVMEKSPHVMMVGDGAEKFAREQGLAFVDPKYFFTENRWKALQDAIKEEKAAQAAGKKTAYVTRLSEWDDHKYGTVGAVAVDRAGNLAAATSTGGMTNKRYGRVGDTPIIGAGTYANNATCAVSATGTGEYFIRGVVAHDISALMEYRGMSVADAANTVVMDKLVKMGGDGGVIAVDRAGNFAMTFNTEGMFRGTIDEKGNISVAIYK